MKLKVKVLKSDINRGVRDNTTSCPIARSLKRMITGYVCVGSRSVTILGKPDFPLPEEAQKFVTRFDHNKKVKPFEFELEIG